MFLKFRSWKAFAETPSHPAHLSDGKRWNSKKNVSFLNTFCHILVNWYRPGPIFFNRPPLQMAACPIVDTLPAVDTDPGGSWKNGWTSQTLQNPTGPFPSAATLYHTAIHIHFKMYIWILYILYIYFNFAPINHVVHLPTHSRASTLLNFCLKRFYKVALSPNITVFPWSSHRFSKVESQLIRKRATLFWEAQVTTGPPDIQT